MVQYLHDTLGDFVRTLVESEDDCEVDPTKVVNNATLQCHQTSLEMYATMAWVKIINSYCYFPKSVLARFFTRAIIKPKGTNFFGDYYVLYVLCLCNVRVFWICIQLARDLTL